MGKRRRLRRCFLAQVAEMAPKMKSAPMMKSAVMTKGALTKALAEKCEVKNGVVSTLLSTLASIATAEAKKNGKFVVPGVVMIKTRQKKATKAGKREMFGQVVGEGEASKDHRQGFPRESNQGRVLRVSRSAASPANRFRACSSSSS